MDGFVLIDKFLRIFYRDGSCDQGTINFTTGTTEAPHMLFDNIMFSGISELNIEKEL